jgi:ABC-type phosphate transport system substrate-binding protein
LLAGAQTMRGSQPAGAFKVIVHPTVGGQKIPRAVLAQIYLGDAQNWGDGRRIVAVDQSTTSTTRAAFSTAVLGMPVEGVKRHWLRVLASGKRPPRIKDSDREVISFVAAEPGAVGYVSDAAAVPAGVRVLDLD